MEHLKGICLICLLVAITPAATHAKDVAEPPRVAVKDVRQVFDNGEHNAFTDLIRWKDGFWLAFRSNSNGHPINSDSAIIVLSSSDTKIWKEAYRFSLPDRDTRGPHFLIFNEQLFLFAAGIQLDEGASLEDHWKSEKNFGCTVSTKDGEHWSKVKPLTGTNGYFIWGAATYGKKAYLSGRRSRQLPATDEKGKSEQVGETALFDSTDGLEWKITSVYHQDRGDETSFLFEENGDFIAVTRRGGPYTARLLRAKSPYQEWEHKDLPFFIGGPLLKKWGERYIVGGRRNSKNGKKTGLWWLVDEKLKSMAILPSGGDNSYPGFAAIDDTHGIISWYSSHEKDKDGKIITAIYLADLEIQ